jgi:hypothetical protein
VIAHEYILGNRHRCHTLYRGVAPVQRWLARNETSCMLPLSSMVSSFWVHVIVSWLPSLDGLAVINQINILITHQTILTSLFQFADGVLIFSVRAGVIVAKGTCRSMDRIVRERDFVFFIWCRDVCSIWKIRHSILPFMN